MQSIFKQGLRPISGFQGLFSAHIAVTSSPQLPDLLFHSLNFCQQLAILKIYTYCWEFCIANTKYRCILILCLFTFVLCSWIRSSISSYLASCRSRTLPQLEARLRATSWKIFVCVNECNVDNIEHYLGSDWITNFMYVCFIKEFTGIFQEVCGQYLIVK